MLRTDQTKSLSFNILVTCLLAVGVFAFAAIAVLQTHAQNPGQEHEWRMIGQDVGGNRSQQFESTIGPANAHQLAPKWTFTTAGDVSATPAVVGPDDHDDNGRRADRGRFVYFPDWGGKLWKLDAADGHVLWSSSISSYNGIAGSLSRTSPVVAHGMVYVGDLNGNMMGIDAETGALRWKTRLDPHPAVIVTTSPIILGDRLYISTSSNESRQPPACCTFRGSMLALNARTGAILWQSFVLPDNGGQPGGFAGGAFVNPPAIDLENGLIYGGAGQLYTQPASVTSCLAAAGGFTEACFPSNAYFNSVVAFDLNSGEPRWSFRGAGPTARVLGCGNPAPAWCPSANNFSVWDFAGSGANVFRTKINGRWRNVVGIGQKSGVYWALDAATGELLWSKLVGPGSDPGGIQWGTAYDGERIYAAIGHNTRVAYTLPSGQVITGGSWAALDPSTGQILWQTPDPQNVPDLAALTVANSILYAGSLAHTGNQMYALDTKTGAILWRFAAGGSVVSGPAVVRGAVYWGSGYARTGGVGNNKFYAFSIGGK